MYCPGCGVEEIQTNQFCRKCGADLGRVRASLESPDSVTASAITAREEIGRAIAAKIRETQSAYDLKKVAEDVLPQIEKFLESPEEKRLRNMRTGSIIASIGVGATIGLSLAAFLIEAPEMLFLAALGLVTFFIGVGFLINGLLLTTPKKNISPRSSPVDTDKDQELIPKRTSDLALPPLTLFSSVTENTTRHLTKEESSNQ